MKTTKKKSFKRLFAFLMAFVMVTALAANAVFAAGSFTDVKEGDDFYENIESLYEQGIIGGFADGTFRPGDYLTRQQAAKMIALGAGYGDHDGTGSKLIDVADLTWGQENIWALEADGVVKGFGTSKEFRPRLNITRGHVAKMIALAFGLEEGPEEVELKDLPADEEVADAIRILASNGIVKGFGTSKEFRPDALVTRGQFAKMVDLAMEAAVFRVVSVRAVDGVTVEVRFNKPVDKNSALQKGAYGLSEKVTIEGVRVWPESLSDDGKVLTLRVSMHYSYSEAINIYNAKVEVKPVVSRDDGSVSSEKYVGTLTYKDTVAPFVVKVEGKDESAEITFNEKLVALPGVTVDGALATVAFKADSDNKVLVISDLTNGTTYDVEIVGAKDTAENVANPINLKVTPVAPDEQAKQDVTIASSGSKVTLAFVNALSSSNVAKVKFEPGAATAFSLNPNTTVAGITYSTDKKTVTIDTQLYSSGSILGVLSFLKTKVTVTEAGLDSTKTYAKDITLYADKVAPKLVSSKVNAAGKLQLVFDKDVQKLSSIALTITHIGGVAQDPVKTDGLTNLGVAYAVDKDSKQILDTLEVTLPMTVTSQQYFKKDVLYVVEFAKDIVLDAYGNKADKFTATFTIPDADPAEADKVIKVAASVDPSTGGTKKIKLTFDAPKDLTDASANAANFKLGGQALPAGSTVQFVNDKKNIEITLPAGSIVTSGARNLTLANIADLDGNTLKAGEEVKPVTLTENVAPTIVSAELMSNATIKVTFSEKVSVAADKVKLLVGAEDEVIAYTPIAANSEALELTITITTPLDAAGLAKTIQIKVLEDGVKDVAANPMVKDTVANVIQ